MPKRPVVKLKKTNPLNRLPNPVGVHGINRMHFPHPVQPSDPLHYDWFNQITEYVTELEKRVADLERMQKGEGVDGSLSSNPWISDER